MTSSKPLKYIFTFFTGAFVLFIFSNSLFPGAESSEKSTFALQVITKILAFFHINLPITEHVVRKAAHFIEYFGLGCLLIVTVRMYTPRPVKHIFMELFILLAVPVTDECIQLHIPNRAGSVQDVALDFCGAAAGLILALLTIHFVNGPAGKNMQRKDS